MFPIVLNVTIIFYFDAPIILDLANGIPFKCVHMIFWHITIILWALPCFLTGGVPGSSTFPASIFEPAISPRIPGSFFFFWSIADLQYCVNFCYTDRHCFQHYSNIAFTPLSPCGIPITGLLDLLLIYFLILTLSSIFCIFWLSRLYFGYMILTYVSPVSNLLLNLHIEFLFSLIVLFTSQIYIWYFCYSFQFSLKFYNLVFSPLKIVSRVTLKLL